MSNKETFNQIYQAIKDIENTKRDLIIITKELVEILETKELTNAEQLYLANVNAYMKEVENAG